MQGTDSAGFLGTCSKHYAERAVAQCQDCGAFWCADCLVPPVSKHQPLRCIECALIAGGVKPRGRRRPPVNLGRGQRLTGPAG